MVVVRGQEEMLGLSHQTIRRPRLLSQLPHYKYSKACHSGYLTECHHIQKILKLSLKLSGALQNGSLDLKVILSDLLVFRMVYPPKYFCDLTQLFQNNMSVFPKVTNLSCRNNPSLR